MESVETATEPADREPATREAEDTDIIEIPMVALIDERDDTKLGTDVESDKAESLTEVLLVETLGASSDRVDFEAEAGC